MATLILFLASTIFLPAYVVAGCCMPWKVSGRMESNIFITNDTFLIDFKKNKILLIPFEGKTSTGEVLHKTNLDHYNHYRVVDFLKGKSYVHSTHDDSCIAFNDPLFKNFPRCVPDNAKNIEEDKSVFAAYPDKKFETWEYRTGKIKLRFSISFHKDSCWPIHADYNGRGPNNLFRLEFDQDPSFAPRAKDVEKLDEDNSDCKNGPIIG